MVITFSQEAKEKDMADLRARLLPLQEEEKFRQSYHTSMCFQV